jgi:hypothetical protein
MQHMSMPPHTMNYMSGGMSAMVNSNNGMMGGQLLQQPI